MSTLPPEIAPLMSALSGQYEFEREVGRGGMGIVYLARDLKLDRAVAIKTLPPHLMGDSAVRERFLREARTAASLSHPNIVPIFRADDLAGRVFFAMGYVDGAPLSQIIREHGRLSPQAALPLLRDVASALGYAHGLGVVHRDIKAENILVEGATGRAMVTDFGIARLAEASPLTATGMVLGTVHYMSPEQVSGDEVDGRSDLYALGCLGFLALTGRFPFAQPTAPAVLVAHVTQAPPPLRALAPDVPDSVARIIDRLLAKAPSARQQTAEEVMTAIDEALLTLPPDTELQPPVLSSTDAQRVWERAAQLQDMTGQIVPPARFRVAADQPPGPPATTGYRLGDVREAALEAGIDVKYVDRALSERQTANTDASASGLVRPGMVPGKNPFLGEATTIAYEAVVDGEMPERDFDMMVEHIRRAMNDGGVMSAVGRSLSWSSSDRQRKVSISVLVRGGRTSIYVSERLGDLAGGLFGGIMGGGGGGMIGPAAAIGANVFHSGVVAAGLAVGWIGLAYGTARFFFGRATRSRRKVLSALAERLAEQARESMQPRFIANAKRPNLLGRTAREE